MLLPACSTPAGQGAGKFVAVMLPAPCLALFVQVSGTARWKLCSLQPVIFSLGMWILVSAKMCSMSSWFMVKNHMPYANPLMKGAKIGDGL